jgi:hypothetical protein
MTVRPSNPDLLTERDVLGSPFHCCGDEDLVFLRCPACAHIMVFCYECDTLYLDLADTSQSRGLTLTSRGTRLQCPRCDRPFEDPQFLAPENVDKYLPTERQVREAGFGHLLVSDRSEQGPRHVRPRLHARPLFDFKLRALDDIVPWGKPGALSLSWFSLTDGSFWLNVGDEQLFVGADAGEGSRFVDYQVVRLWEDVLDILPAVLEPVPESMAALLEPSNGWLAWCRRASDWGAESDDLELLDQAISWELARRLDSAYLAAGPNIWLCRVGERIRILWDNRNRIERGLPIWATSSGRVELTVDDFLASVRDFNDRLMHAMGERVQVIQAGWSRHDVKIDLEMLAHEQRDRSTWLDNAIMKRAAARPPTDWDAVSGALRRVQVAVG